MNKHDPVFGERVRGKYASKDNPHRDGFYVKTIRRTGRMNPGKYYQLTDGDGAFWEYEAKDTTLLRSNVLNAMMMRGLQSRLDECNKQLDRANNENRLLTKKVAFLKGELAQLANFNPDWDMLEASRESLREKMQEIVGLKDQLDATNN